MLLCRVLLQYGHACTQRLLDARAFRGLSQHPTKPHGPRQARLTSTDRVLYLNIWYFVGHGFFFPCINFNFALLSTSLLNCPWFAQGPEVASVPGSHSVPLSVCPRDSNSALASGLVSRQGTAASDVLGPISKCDTGPPC